MAITYKVLGQSNPSATTATTAYTVPSATQAVVSTITVCNQGAGSATYRIAVQPAGEALAAKHYVAYDVALTGNSVDTLTLGISLAATDVITVYASNTSLSFNVFGTEIA
jgi:hypothetical protein